MTKAKLPEAPIPESHVGIGRMGAKNWTPEMDGPGAERVIITIVPTQVSTPTLYGGQLDQRAAKFAESQKPSAP